MDPTIANPDKSVPQPDAAPAPPPVGPAYPGGTHRGLRVFLILLVVLLVGGGITTGVLLTKKTATDQESESSVPSALVVINADQVSPATIQVKRGQSVVWTNEDEMPHSLVLSGDSATVQGADSPEQLNQDETYTYVFNQSGTYNYYDAANPGRLKGVIIVE